VEDYGMNFEGMTTGFLNPNPVEKLKGKNMVLLNLEQYMFHPEGC
jgi:hypothetical protein